MVLFPVGVRILAAPTSLITPAKQKQALALAKEGRTVSLAHYVAQEKARILRTHWSGLPSMSVRLALPTRYQYTGIGIYHGVIHSHLDAVDCHIMSEGKGYNGRSMEDIKATGGCPNGNINALKDGVVTRGIVFDATLLPGKASPGLAGAWNGGAPGRP